MPPRLAAMVLGALVSALSPDAVADEASFVHAAGTVGDERVSAGLDVSTSWFGRGASEIAPTLRLSYGIARRTEVGVRVGAVGDSVDGFSASKRLQVPILFELNLGAIKEEGQRWEVGVALLVGVRNFGGRTEWTQPEGGLEVSGSVRLGSRFLGFARAGYSVTRVGQGGGFDGVNPGYHQHQDHWAAGAVPAHSLLRHSPSLTVGLEVALGGLRPYLGVQGGLRFDPGREVDPRGQVVAGVAYVF